MRVHWYYQGKHDSTEHVRSLAEFEAKHNHPERVPLTDDAPDKLVAIYRCPCSPEVARIYK
jgi:hypothetical protein